MLAAERRLRIIEYVNKHHSATISTLAEAFNVHEATIRRDLTSIERTSNLKRTHGGVIVEKWAQVEPSFNERAGQNPDEKMRIGKMAASLVEDGDNIIIDSGTTTLHIAKNLVHRTNLTVVTNDINIAATLRDSSAIEVILTGGELYPASYMLNGMFTNHVLKSLHVLKAFIGTPALHPQYGLMHMEAKLVPAKQCMIQAAREVIVVTDHTKIGNLALHTIVPNSDIHALITGREATDEALEPFRNAEINVYTV
ncbi:DeoR/GlpR transcriptional regulator [Bacillaceae bacterium Marseille-Q3522]|nr:DeoR/GlpR transcriptional regulator [Bacillaceae bacterium Marseille-Q3522]